MRLYSTSIDARDSHDENINICAFTEIIFALVFRYSLCVNAGSLFDSESLHLVWNEYYKSFVKFKRSYNDEEFLPLIVYFEKNRYKDIINENDKVYKLASQFLSGHLSGLDGSKVILSPDDTSFNIANKTTVRNIRSHRRFSELQHGDPHSLGLLPDAVVAESIKSLNDYLNRNPNAVVLYDEPPFDILNEYIISVDRFSKRIRDANPGLHDDLTRGLQRIKNVPPHFRGSTSALIRHAKDAFEENFNLVIRPITKIISSCRTAKHINPNIFSNYEYSRILNVGRDEFNSATEIINGNHTYNSGSIVSRRPIVLNMNPNIANPAINFDWDGLNNIVSQKEYRDMADDVWKTPDPDARKMKMQRFIQYASGKLSGKIPLKLEYESGESITLEIFNGIESNRILRYLTKIADKIIDYVPVEPAAKDTIEQKIVKNTLSAVAPSVANIGF